MSRRLLLILVALAFVGAIAWRFYPRPSPEVAAGPPIVDVKVPELDAAAKAGEAAFNQNCARCHGANAVGQEGVAPPLVHIIYEPNHHGDQSFYRAAKQGVPAHHWPFGDMPPVEGISDPEIERIVTYIRTLQRANGIM
jgi:mono/diheme cytochrome c family protein